MSKSEHSKWVSKRPEMLPDFIIGGAMKSGTTTLHSILDQHPKVNLAHNELGFFDIDSIIAHPDFSFFNSQTKEWTTQSMRENSEILWEWYYSNFESKRTAGGIIGEDSTTYLSSPIAAKRIALQEKPIKMIFILRHPTSRSISNYLHALKSGRAIYNLEDTLRYNPSSILKRSMYKEQLEVYYKYLPFEQIKVVTFEDFISNTKSCVLEVCDFLGIDFSEFKESDLKIHSNKTKIPKNENLQLLRNRMLRYFGDTRYASHLPVCPSEVTSKVSFSHRLVDKIHKKLNPKQSKVKYKSNPETVAYLDAYFETYMEGLNELVNKDITSKWFK